MTLPDSQIARALVGYYGLFQFVHVLVNTRGLYFLYADIPLDFPAPPPAGGVAARNGELHDRYQLG